VSDLRFKQFKQKAGILIIFAVDASGSMAVNRISQAKGALMRLLEKAYLHRDLVALVGFRGDRADVLLPPSRSVELAKRAIDAMPVGGGTPLAAALESALALARRARHTGIRRTLLVLLTDGHANVARGREPIWHELEGLCGALQCEGVASVVVDTRNQVTSGGEARMLADLLGGRHVRLSHPGSDALYDTVAAAAETM
jgi:magnesium chelatase subunit D